MLELDAPKWDLVPPAFSYLPEWEYTLGPEMADLNALMKFPPDPEQELILDAVFAVASDGLPAAAEGTVVASRQNVKSSGYEMVCNGWLFGTKEPQVLWSAHEFKTAKENFLHMQAVISSCRWAERRVKQFYTGGGDLSVVLWETDRTGMYRRMDFVARTTASGRGKTAPKQVWDEGLELREEHMAAADAITSTFPWAQTLIGSSGAKAYSTVLHQAVDRGRQGEPGRYFHLEWCDNKPGGCEMGEECSHVFGTQGCRLDDRERIRMSNPTVGRIRPDGRGLTMAAIRRERRRQPNPLKFARERLGWHEALAVDGVTVFTEADWSALARPKSRIVSDRTLALHVAPDLSWSAIVAGGRNGDGKIHLEVTSKKVGDRRIYNRRQSTVWVVPTLRKMVRKAGSIRLLVMAGSPAATLLPALAKIDGLEVVLVPESSMPQACAFLLGAASREEIMHVGDPELQASMLSVTKKLVGQKIFVWASSGGDITAAMAATMIAWHVEQGAGYDPEESVG